MIIGPDRANFLYSTTIISILRAIASADLDVVDATWGYVPTAKYSTIETNVGMVCACLPVLAPLVSLCSKRHFAKRNSDFQRTHSSNTSHTKRSRPSAREQSFSRLQDDDAGLVYLTTLSTARGNGTLESTREEDSAVALGQMTVRQDIHVESTLKS